MEGREREGVTGYIMVKVWKLRRKEGRRERKSHMPYPPLSFIHHYSYSSSSHPFFLLTFPSTLLSSSLHCLSPFFCSFFLPPSLPPYLNFTAQETPTLKPGTKHLQSQPTRWPGEWEEREGSGRRGWRWINREK